MNKHTKLVVGILIVVLVLLIIATISFSIDISKNSDASSGDDSVETVIDSNGNQIIQDENYLYGVSDSGGNVMITPEWQQLHFIGAEYLAATEGTEDGRRVGVIDLDGNIVAPFVYTEVHALNDFYYLATLADTEQYVLYDGAFRVLDRMVWDQCTWEENSLTLVRDKDAFLFAVNEDMLTLTQVDLSRTDDDVSFAVNWTNENKTAVLSPQQWLHVTDMVQSFLHMLKSQDFTELETVTDQEHENVILSAASFSEEKITQIDPTIYLAVTTTEDGNPVLTWQINVVFLAQDSATKNRTLSLSMAENQQGVWVATEIQIA